MYTIKALLLYGNILFSHFAFRFNHIITALYTFASFKVVSNTLLLADLVMKKKYCSLPVTVNPKVEISLKIAIKTLLRLDRF